MRCAPHCPGVEPARGGGARRVQEAERLTAAARHGAGTAGHAPSARALATRTQGVRVRMTDDFIRVRPPSVRMKRQLCSRSGASKRGCSSGRNVRACTGAGVRRPLPDSRHKRIHVVQARL